MTYEQAKTMKLIERADMVSPCWDCIYNGPIVTSEKGIVYHEGCQHPRVKGSFNEAWRCWHPVQRNDRGVELPRTECEWLIYFSPTEEFRKKYEKVIPPVMTPEEKGYICPDDCDHCEYKNTKCIVYSKAGKKKYSDWKKNRFIAESEPDDVQTVKLKLEDSPVWEQGELF